MESVDRDQLVRILLQHGGKTTLSVVGGQLGVKKQDLLQMLHAAPELFDVYGKFVDLIEGTYTASDGSTVRYHSGSCRRIHTGSRQKRHFTRWVEAQLAKGIVRCNTLFDNYNAEHEATIRPPYNDFHGFVSQLKKWFTLVPGESLVMVDQLENNLAQIIPEAVMAVSKTASCLEPFLLVHEVAHLRQTHRSADSGRHLKRRLAQERPSYHNGVIRYVNFDKKYGLVESDAGRRHIIVMPDMHFYVADGQQLVSLENNTHAQFFTLPADAMATAEVRVTFDLALNFYKGEQKNLKAVNVKVKLV